MTLSRLLPVLPEERGKVFFFALFAGVLQAGVAIGMTAADSLFLGKLGADRLPYVYVCMPVVMALYAPAYSFCLARFGIDRLVPLTLGAVATGALLLGLAPAAAETRPAWLLFAGKFFAGMWFIGLYTLFWNFTDNYFSLRDGKRLYGVVAAGGSLGGMGGAMLVTTLAEMVSPGRLFLAWSGVALIAIPVFAALRRRFRTIESEQHDDEESATPGQVLATVFRTFRESRFALGVTVLCFAAVSLMGMLEFLAMSVFSANRSADALAVLLGRLQAGAQFLTLLVNLVLFGRIVGRLGVATTALVLPLTYAVAFLGLHLHPSFVTAVIAFYAYQCVLPGVEYNNVNLLFNALATRVKALLRTFVEAMAEPLATAFTGACLLSLATRLGREHLALVGLGAAGGALTIALLTRLEYPRALADNLRDDRLDFSDSRRDLATTLDAADRTLLTQKAKIGTRGEKRIAAVLLWRVRDPEARRLVFGLLASAEAAEVPRLRPSLSLLAQGDAATAAETAKWLTGPAAPTDPEVLDELSAAGLIAPKRGATNAPMPSPVATNRSATWTLRAIGDAEDATRAPEVLAYLANENTAIRTEALRTLGKLATPRHGEWIDLVLPLLRGATTEQRLLIFRLAGRVGGTDRFAALLHAMADFNAAERRALEALLLAQGTSVVPVMRAVLRDRNAPMVARAVCTRTLARLDLPLLLGFAREQVELELREAEQYLAAHCTLTVTESGPTELLRRYYRDMTIATLGLVLELLSRAGRLPDCELIRASLWNASARDRANALESVQQSCSRPTFNRILRLVEATQEATTSTNERAPSDAASVIRAAAASGVPLERLLGQYAAGGSNSTRSDLDSVEAIHVLLRSPFFSAATIASVHFLACRSALCELEAGDELYARGAPLEPYLYVVASGSVAVSRPGREIVAQPGDVFGERALMLDTVRSDRAVSQGATVLILPVPAVLRAIEVQPSLGIGLYRFKTISAVR